MVQVLAVEVMEVLVVVEVCVDGASASGIKFRKFEAELRDVREHEIQPNS